MTCCKQSLYAEAGSPGAILSTRLETSASLSTRCTEKLATLAWTGEELLNPQAVTHSDLLGNAKPALCGCFLIWETLRDFYEEPAAVVSYNAQ